MDLTKTLTIIAMNSLGLSKNKIIAANIIKIEIGQNLNLLLLDILMMSKVCLCSNYTIP